MDQIKAEQPNAQHKHLRKRVTKACDSCRTKKIKCDGQEPCVHCTRYGCPCTYTHVVRRRRAPSTRVSNRKILSDLSSRISKLEELLVQIRDQVHGKPAESTASDSPFSAAEGAEEDSRSDSDFYSSLSESDVDDKISESVGRPMTMTPSLSSQHKRPKLGLPSFTLGPTTNSEADDNEEQDEIDYYSGVEMRFSPEKGTPSAGASCKVEGFVGAHSVFSLLSKEGLLWLQRKLGGRSETILPLLQVRNIVVHSNDSCSSILLDRVGPNTLPFELPPTEICDMLFKVFLEQMLNITRLAFEPDCIELFDKFRKSPESLNRSENFLLLNILLLATIYMGHCDEHESIFDWKNVHFKILVRTIQVYQQTILCFMDDSLKYIQGVALFCWYLENSPVPYQVYCVLTAAIRLAQEVGLHDRETYRNITDPVDIRRRKTIWLGLYRYDRCISTRTGKPSLIHDHDTTSLNDWDFYQESCSLLRGEPVTGLRDDESPNPSMEWVENLDANVTRLATASLEGLAFSMRYCFYKLTQYAGRSYQYLLSSNAVAHKSERCRKMLVEKLSQELEEWRNLLPEPLKIQEDVNALPQVLEKLESYPHNLAHNGITQFAHTTPDRLYFQLLGLHMEYYLNMMYTNCVVRTNPWYTKPGKRNRSAKNSPALERCALASRNLLKLCRLILSTKAQYHFMLADVVYSFFSGFLNLFYRCLEFPQMARDDLLLMSTLISSMVEEVSTHWTSYPMKWSTVSFTSLHLLKAAVIHYNRYCTDEALKLNFSELGKYLKIIQQHLLEQTRDVSKAALAKEGPERPPPLVPDSVSCASMFPSPQTRSMPSADGDLLTSSVGQTNAIPAVPESKPIDFNSWFINPVFAGGLFSPTPAPESPAGDAAPPIPGLNADTQGQDAPQDLLFNFQDFDLDEPWLTESSNSVPSYFRF